MLTYSDTDRRRFATQPDVQIGDIARFPLGRLGDETTYNRTWEVIAFGGQHMRHCVVMRRRHDKVTKTIALHWWRSYAERVSLADPTREEALARTRRRQRRQPTEWQLLRERQVLVERIWSDRCTPAHHAQARRRLQRVDVELSRLRAAAETNTTNWE